MADLTPYVPRLLLEWDDRYDDAKHQAIDGTLVFADVSGFTKLSEALARKGGKAGAEEMADVINYLFGELLMLAAVRGGEMLKYGGDAMLLFFSGDAHAVRAAAACADMQRRLREIGRVDTGIGGVVRLKMSVGAHSGSFDFFVGGRCHRELVVAGPATTTTVEMEATADATEVLMSPAMAEQLPARNVGATKDGGFLLRGNPKAPLLETVPLTTDVDARTFLSAPLVRHLGAEGATPDHRLSTVAFLQFMELDPLLAAGRTAEAADRVDRVLTLVQEAFLEFGVTFLATDLAADGGKVMAAAGAPVTHGDDEERMLRACRRILDSSPPLPVRIGLNRGHVFAGDVGPRFRRTYTTLGDVTNTAARVMGKAAKGQLFALGSVLDRSAARFRADEQPPFMAKGKSEPLVPFAVHEATGKRSERTPDVPLLGRDGEIDAVASRVVEILVSGGALRVTGADGMGKTSVARAGAARAGVTVLEASAHDHVGVPYGLLRAFAPDVASAVTAAPELRPWAPLLAIVHGVDVDPTPEVDALDSSVILTRLAAAVAASVVAVHGTPLVVLLDDVHLADHASRDVLELLAGPARVPGLAIVETAEEASGDDRANVAVGPLRDTDAARLVRTAAGRPLLPQQVRSLVDRGDGNPMFLCELARTAGNDADSLPESVEAIIAARIDRLAPSARAAVRAASVLGTSFDADLVRELLGVEPPWDLLRDVVVTDGASGRFIHAAARVAAYEGLPFRRRRALHHQAALTLESAGGDAERLSYHFAVAGVHDKAWTYGIAAARSAADNYAYADAAVLFARALAGERHVDASPEARAHVWRELGLAHAPAGEIDQALRAFAQARRRTSDIALRANLTVAEVDMLTRVGDVDRAERRCRRALRDLADADDEAVIAQRARMKLSVAECRRQRGDVATARRWCDAAIVDAQRSQERRVEMHARSLDHLLAVMVQADDREMCGAVAQELASEVGTPAERGRVANNIALDLQMRGDLAGAQRMFEDAHAEFIAAGTPLDAAVTANNLGEIAIELRDFERAEKFLLEALETFEAAGTWMAIVALANLGTLSSRCGRRAEAVAYLERAAGSASAMQRADLLADIDQRRAEADASVEGDAAPARTNSGASAI